MCSFAVGIDRQVGYALQADLEAAGVKLLFETEVTHAEAADVNPRGVHALRRSSTLSSNGALQLSLADSRLQNSKGNLQCDLLLTATGRRAVSGSLGLEAAGVAASANGDIIVRSDLMTSKEGVYAAGDVIGAPQLASTGISQAEAAVDAMFERAPEASRGATNPLLSTQPAVQRNVSPQALLSSIARYPIGIWTVPELAFVGLTAEAAAEAPHHLDVIEGIGRYSDSIRGHVHTVGTPLEGEYLTGMALRAAAAGEGGGEGDAGQGDLATLTGPTLKLVVERDAPHVVVGVHIFGDDACELIHFGTTLVQERKSLSDILAICYAAVTYHELYKLAALDAIKLLRCEGWRALYASLDADGDGVLTKDEVSRRLGAMCTAEDADALMRALFGKASGTSSVSVDTFVKRAQKLRAGLQVNLMESTQGTSTDTDYERLM